MAHSFPCPQTSASVLAATAVIALGLCLVTAPEPARAAPMIAPALGSQASPVEPVGQIFRRGRTPIYPYSYKRRPGGWSTYFGFVPYSKGDIENQALKRAFYPQNTWPHSNTAEPPNPWGYLASPRKR